MEILSMKKKSLKRGKLGFTLTELLAVIAVIVILIGLGIPSFLALRRTIKIAEYDDIAREIYVAAQNQLTSLSANGMDQATTITLKSGSSMIDRPSDAGDEPFIWTNYYYADQSGAAMAVLLPLGSVADDVRSNGFYVIEYNTATNMVYSVFYSEQSFDYSAVSVMENFRTSRDVRKGPMVGYYGGSAVARDTLNRCAVPELEIVNENVLQLNILNAPNDVIIRVSVSDGQTTAEVDRAEIWQNLSTRSVLLDSMESGKHFCELFPGLTPGNDLTITVTYEKDGLLPSSASISANSLFATREPGNGADGTGDAVTIAWARHLQNLEGSVSHLNDSQITRARQTDHIQWEADEFGSFVSIQGSNLARYEGGNLEIRDLRGSNGLFATATDMSLSGIRLVNPAITADENNLSAPVGALVGTITGTPEKKAEIASCAVYYSKLKDDYTVNYNAYEDCGVDGKRAITGGLVGSAENVNVYYSFAALPRIDAEQGGTLIGSASNCTIENSYANCDNLPNQPNFYYFLSGSGNTVTHCYAVGSVENTADGAFAAPGNTATDSYYAVSHTDWKTDPFTDLSATEFLYTESGSTWQKTNQEGLNEAFKDNATWSVLSAPLSHPYRQHLDGRAYPYPAINMTDGTLEHHGSWPTGDGTVDLKITMRLLNNEDARYASFAGQVIVTDLSSDPENPVVLFDSSKDYQTEGDEIIKVAPGTKVKIAIIPLDSGYSYVNTTISAVTDITSYETTLDHTVEKDTEVIVTFQQSAYTLSCTQPIDDSGKPLQNGTYFVDTLNGTMTPEASAEVSTGSSVIIRPRLPGGSKVGVVWYTTSGSDERHTLIPDSRGYYTFEMPGQDTQIHVQYTKRVAKFTVNYYVMDAETGRYHDQGDDNKPTRTATMEYGIGTVISDEMIRALAENSGYLQTISDTEVLYLDPGKSEAFSKNSDTPLNLPYITQYSDQNDTFTINIYIAR